MCSRLEYASSRFQASERQRKGTATASETSPKPTRTPCAMLLADGGRRAPASERHATTSTAGRSALERRAETGGGASECASGSQLCTGAQPIFAARPARRSTNATESWSDAGVERGERAPREPAEPALHVGGDEHDPEQREPEPERRQHEVLPAGLESRRSPAEADEERRSGRRGLDQQPGDAEVPGEGHGDEHGPEGEERRRSTGAARVPGGRARCGSAAEVRG